MVKPLELFSKIEKKRILVAGDFILDSYTFGTAERISPEAPVPIVRAEREDEKPGGAGNVALNLRALNMEVTAFGIAGNDAPGSILQRLLQDNGISLVIHESSSYETPHKRRIIAGTQQLCRIDQEKQYVMDEKEEQEVLSHIPELISQHDLLAISDYAKGFLTDTILRKLIQEANKKGIPVLVDPKGLDFEKYRGATLIKPNQLEAYMAAGMGKEKPIEEVMSHLAERAQVEYLLVTRSGAGMSLLYSDGTFEHHPVVVRDVRDTTGAGDTVLSLLAASLANGLSLKESCHLSNVAASIAIEKVGCAQVSLSDIARLFLERGDHNKVFSLQDEELLQHIFSDEKSVIFQIPSSLKLNQSLIRCMQRVYKEEKKRVIIEFEKKPEDEEMIHLFASFREVEAIFLDRLPPSFTKNKQIIAQT